MGNSNNVGVDILQAMSEKGARWATTIAVSKVVVGTRARKSFPNIEELMESVGPDGHGLVQPIVLNVKDELIAGGRRLEAFRRLRIRRIPCFRAVGLTDVLAAMKAERDENTCREPLSPSEMAELGRRIEAVEKPAAADRKSHSGQERGGKLPPRSRGKTRDKVAEAIGVSGKTYEKIKEVVEAGKRQPDLFSGVVEEMDRTGKVDPAFKKVKGKVSKPKTPLDDLAPVPAKALGLERVRDMNDVIRIARMIEMLDSTMDGAERGYEACLLFMKWLKDGAPVGGFTIGRSRSHLKDLYALISQHEDDREVDLRILLARVKFNEAHPGHWHFEANPAPTSPRLAAAA